MCNFSNNGNINTCFLPWWGGGGAKKYRLKTDCGNTKIGNFAHNGLPENGGSASGLEILHIASKKLRPIFPDGAQKT